MRIRPETKKRIQSALSAALSAIAPNQSASKSKRLQDFWKGMVELLEKYKPSPDQILAAGIAAGVLSKVSQKQPTEKELIKLLNGIKTIPYEVRSIMKSQLKSLPRRRGTGRQKLLNPEEERQVCVLVGSLYSQGVELTNAFQRVARQYSRDRKISARTIKRTWENRAKLSQAPGTMDSVPK